jgi:hypothetical protein
VPLLRQLFASPRKSAFGEEWEFIGFFPKGWPSHSRGTWQLYGHSHGNLPDDPISLSMDVGVDSHDFRPWNFDEIKAVMKGKEAAKAKHIEMREFMAGRDES